MAGFTYSTLTTAIQNYTEVGTSVLSSTITDQFIDNSELRIQRDIPIDADRREVIGNLVASKIMFMLLLELYLLEDYKFILQRQQQQELIVG
jgi:hypothetical protein